MWFRCFLFCVQIKKPNKICPTAILLMDDILHHLECKKKTVNNKINYQPQLVNAGFLVAINPVGLPVSAPPPFPLIKTGLIFPCQEEVGTSVKVNLVPSSVLNISPPDRRHFFVLIGVSFCPRWDMWSFSGGSWLWREVEVVMQMMMAKKMILFWNLCDGWDYVGLCHWFGSDGKLSKCWVASECLKGSWPIRPCL